jgi:hypothetical protein
MVHTIKIFVLYVGIVAVIQEHASDHCHGRVSRDVYIYSTPSKREGAFESGLGKYQNGSIISRVVLEGSETLLVSSKKASK